MSFICARHAGLKTNLREEPKRAVLHYLHKINFSKMKKKKETNKNNVCFTKMPSYRCIIRKKEKCSLTLELHL